MEHTIREPSAAHDDGKRGSEHRESDRCQEDSPPLRTGGGSVEEVRETHRYGFNRISCDVRRRLIATRCPPLDASIRR